MERRRSSVDPLGDDDTGKYTGNARFFRCTLFQTEYEVCLLYESLLPTQCLSTKKTIRDL